MKPNPDAQNLQAEVACFTPMRFSETTDLQENQRFVVLVPNLHVGDR
ncbi:MAG: hypothetical protein KatS3mg104_2846 [Phycisphaerae bacterium]|jgi:hypothetical protein|nr:MAG: hypothetical protein KatS3mg104_2846 [Phycisphaerae bacterium]